MKKDTGVDLRDTYAEHRGLTARVYSYKVSFQTEGFLESCKSLGEDLYVRHVEKGTCFFSSRGTRRCMEPGPGGAVTVRGNDTTLYRLETDAQGRSFNPGEVGCKS